jgi:hypothetical protein
MMSGKEVKSYLCGRADDAVIDTAIATWLVNNGKPSTTDEFDEDVIESIESVLIECAAAVGKNKALPPGESTTNFLVHQAGSAIAQRHPQVSTDGFSNLIQVVIESELKQVFALEEISRQVRDAALAKSQASSFNQLANERKVQADKLMRFAQSGGVSQVLAGYGVEQVEIIDRSDADSTKDFISAFLESTKPSEIVQQNEDEFVDSFLTEFKLKGSR